MPIRQRLARLVIASLGSVVLLAAGWLVLVFPRLDAAPVDPPGHSEAIYLLGGETYGAEMGLEMLDEGLGDVLVLSWPRYGTPVCADGQHRGHRVICVWPEPATTQGEAMLLPDIAEENGWGSVTVATWQAHLPRTRLLVERCYAQDVRFVTTTQEYGRRERLRKALYETFSLAKAAATPGCSDMLPFGLSS